MKKICLVFFVALVFGQLQAQDRYNYSSRVKQNEVSLNLLFTSLGFPEVTYERSVHYRIGIGASGGVALNNNNIYENFILTAFGRYYVGKKRTSGFFFELNSGFFEDGGVNDSNDEHLGLGAGFGFGTKFLTNSNWTFTLYLGGGGNFLSESGGYTRAGISIGKRF